MPAAVNSHAKVNSEHSRGTHFSTDQLADHYGRYQYGEYIDRMFYDQMAKANANRNLCQIYKREYVDCVN